MNENILSRFIAAGEKVSGHTALVDPNATKGRQNRSFDELYSDVVTAARFLEAKGLSPGDRVLIFVPYTYELFIALLAVAYLGGVAVFADIGAHKNMLDHVCQTAEPRFFIGIPVAFILLKNPNVRKIPIKIWHRDLLRSKKVSGITLEIAQVLPSASALFTFTTGTTGRPKAADRSHEFLWRQHNVLSAHQNYAKDEVDLTLWPVFALSNLAKGITSVIPDFNSRKPAKVNACAIHRQMIDCRVTATTGPPILFENLARFWRDTLPPPSLRHVFVGGAPVYPAVARSLARVLPGRRLEAIYGSTEVEPISSISLHIVADDVHFGGLNVGRPVPEATLRICRIDHDRQVEGLVPTEIAAEGEIGEILVAGPHVLEKYFRSEDEYNAAKIHSDGKIWHRTGDAGCLSGGDIILFGRIAFAIRAGKSVFYSFPFEKKMKEQAEVVRSGLVNGTKNTTFFLQVARGTKGQRISNLLISAQDILRKSGLPDAIVRMSKRVIPTDKRHNSRVDYVYLRRRS
jgi:olefin beta-lactone synthetase